MSPGSQSRLGVNPTAEDWRPPPGYASITPATNRTAVGLGTSVGGVGNAVWSRSTQGTALGGNIDKDSNAVADSRTDQSKPINASMDLDADLKDIDDLLSFSTLFPGGAVGNSGAQSEGADNQSDNSSRTNNSSNPFADILEPHTRNSREW